MKNRLSIARALYTSLETEKGNIHPGFKLQPVWLEEGWPGFVAAKEVASTNASAFSLQCCRNIGHRGPKEPQFSCPSIVLLQEAVLVVLEVRIPDPVACESTFQVYWTNLDSSGFKPNIRMVDGC